jgi:preprotein translocase subunit YajC
MQRSLKSGDRILTTGGIYGTVSKVRDDRVIVRISDGVQVEVARNAIASVTTPTDRE